MYGAFEVFNPSDIFAVLAPSNSTSHRHIEEPVCCWMGHQTKISACDVHVLSFVTENII